MTGPLTGIVTRAPRDEDLLDAMIGPRHTWSRIRGFAEFGTLAGPEPALFRQEYLNELPPPPTAAEFREFVRREDSGRVRIARVVVDRLDTARRAFDRVTPTGRLDRSAWTGPGEVFGVPVVESRFMRPGTLVALDAADRVVASVCLDEVTP